MLTDFLICISPFFCFLTESSLMSSHTMSRQRKPHPWLPCRWRRPMRYKQNLLSGSCFVVSLRLPPDLNLPPSSSPLGSVPQELLCGDYTVYFSLVLVSGRHRKMKKTERDQETKNVMNIKQNEEGHLSPWLHQRSCPAALVSGSLCFQDSVISFVNFALREGLD